MNEFVFIAGISGTLMPYAGATGSVLEWTCRREGFLRDVHAGATPTDLISIFEFNVTRGDVVRHRLIDSHEHQPAPAADGHVYPSTWSGGVNLACFLGIVNEHSTEIWVEPDDVLRVRVANVSSEPLRFDVGLLFMTRSLATEPRLWWARIEDGVLVQPVKPNEQFEPGTRRGDYVVVNPYTYVGFEKASEGH